MAAHGGGGRKSGDRRGEGGKQDRMSGHGGGSGWGSSDTHSTPHIAVGHRRRARNRVMLVTDQSIVGYTRGRCAHASFFAANSTRLSTSQSRARVNAGRMARSRT